MGAVVCGLTERAMVEEWEKQLSLGEVFSGLGATKIVRRVSGRSDLCGWWRTLLGLERERERGMLIINFEI